MRVPALVLVAVLASLPPSARGDDQSQASNKLDEPDAFALALETLGISATDLGYRPPATLPRYPHPRTVPYVMPFFEDLLAAPLSTYEFTRLLGNAVEDFLRPDRLRKASEDETLFKLAIMLGTERRIGGMRGFASHVPRTSPPLARVISRVAPQDAETQANAVPQAMRQPLAVFLHALLKAEASIAGSRPGRWQDIAPQLNALSDTTSDGERYFPLFDEVARAHDPVSLAYGSVQALQATQNARRDLAAVAPKGGWPSFHVAFGPPTRRVVVATSDRLSKGDVDACLLALVFGPAPAFATSLGNTGPGRRLSVALLMQPDVVVSAPSTRAAHPDPAPPEAVPPSRTLPQLASGICGCGVVYAAGRHNNLWRTGSWGLGAGCFGMGVLVDEGGNDRYEARNMAQGAAYFGAGLLLDAEGDDRYALREGDGQGMGGPAGIGVLADRSGADRYFVERDPRKAGRADYHSENAIASNNAQGAGFGRRGDISDGHNWAGGLGALLDVDGDDHYEAGNFTQGIGYWYGTGLLWDGGGDDTYRSVYFTQGSGAHFAIGALIDEGGNDRHMLEATSGAGLGFGWDVVNAFLIDRGSGNDYYEAKKISLGVAEYRSNAFFLDEGGNDTYVVPAKAKALGDVDQRKPYTTPHRTSPMYFHLPQAAVFLDLGGADTYEGGGRNDGDWHVRARDADTPGGFNVSLGRDVPHGRVGFLDAWPARGSR